MLEKNNWELKMLDVGRARMSVWWKTALGHRRHKDWCTRWFFVTFLSPGWRSLSPWKGHWPTQKGHKELPGTNCFPICNVAFHATVAIVEFLAPPAGQPDKRKLRGKAPALETLHLKNHGNILRFAFNKEWKRKSQAWIFDDFCEYFLRPWPPQFTRIFGFSVEASNAWLPNSVSK